MITTRNGKSGFFQVEHSPNDIDGPVERDLGGRQSNIGYRLVTLDIELMFLCLENVD